MNYVGVCIPCCCAASDFDLTDVILTSSFSDVLEHKGIDNDLFVVLSREKIILLSGIYFFVQ